MTVKVAPKDVVRAMTGHPRCEVPVLSGNGCDNWVPDWVFQVREQIIRLGGLAQYRPELRCDKHASFSLLDQAYSAAFYWSDPNKRLGARESDDQKSERVGGVMGEQALGHYRRCRLDKCCYSESAEHGDREYVIYLRAVLLVARRLIYKGEL